MHCRFVSVQVWYGQLAVVLVLASVPPQLRAQEVSLDPAKLPRIATVDEQFASYNIEMAEVTGGNFWKPYHGQSSAGTQVAQHAQTASIAAGMNPNMYQYRPPIDLANPQLRKLASAIGPVYVRVSGTWANSIYFTYSDSPPANSPASFSGVLTRKEWKGVIDFVHAVTGKLVTSFATGVGTRNEQGAWTPKQASDWLAYTKSIGGQIAAAEFMNEHTYAAMGGAPKGIVTSYRARGEIMSDKAQRANSILANLGTLLPDLESVYKDIHSHPELSMQENRTASIAADCLRAAGYEVSPRVGQTGVVGLLRNGDGPTVMLRADMDALPVQEATGLPYASKLTATDSTGKTVPVMHACGHDMHVAWLIGVATLLAQNRNAWRGTLMPVFQPAEETGTGSQAMIDDGLFKRFPKPSAILGQHVMVGASGDISTRAGVITSAGDSLQIRMFGRGAHGSMPQASIDPVVMAAATVLRLQTIVSREVAPTDAAVVTVGSLQAGTKENVIPDEAVIKLNVRTFDEDVRKRVLAAIERIVKAEAEASRAPKKPEITLLDRYPLVKNDPDATKRAMNAFRSYFQADRVKNTQPTTASEDFGSFGTEWQVPSVFWFVGGTDPETYATAKKAGTIAELPTNHNPRFAPVIHPTLEAGVEAMVVASQAWLSPEAN